MQIHWIAEWLQEVLLPKKLGVTSGKITIVTIVTEHSVAFQRPAIPGSLSTKIVVVKTVSRDNLLMKTTTKVSKCSGEVVLIRRVSVITMLIPIVEGTDSSVHVHCGRMMPKLARRILKLLKVFVLPGESEIVPNKINIVAIASKCPVLEVESTIELGWKSRKMLAREEVILGRLVL